MRPPTKGGYPPGSQTSWRRTFLASRPMCRTSSRSHREAMTTTTAHDEPFPTTSDSPRPRAATAHRRNHRKVASPPDGLSLPRLYLLRAGYLFVAGGITVTQWPMLIQHDPAWPLMDGVKSSMLAAVSVLALLGVRYPLQMLPVLLFELAWKLIWAAAVVVPLWTADQLDPATLQVLSSSLTVLIVAAVIPWRYVFGHYVTKRGDRWRSMPARTVGQDS
jgi:hypothetical protein